MRKFLFVSFKYCSLFFISLLSIFPFYWMVVSTTNTTNQIAAGKLTVGNQLMNNIEQLFSAYDIPLIMWNSLKITILSVVLSLVVTSLAAFGFEKFQTKTSERIYSLLLIFMIVPLASLVIPLFKMMAGFQLVNNPLSIILLSINNLFLIFFFRQNFKSFPDGILDASKIEGAGDYTIFFKIVVPMMKSTYAAGAIYSFMNTWNSYLLPLIFLQTEDKFTMTLLISSLSTESYVANYNIQMIAIVIATFPTLILFMLMQKGFVKGMTGSLKL
ncbi:carbohydrate ABC transporter permease [Enterococcus saccharolyticus]|uniref:Lactose ABC transporter permease n=1 Tax=Candidatus Enterococcus willemsii TaxID=1857215 RepID=A0ABQ6YWF3_9ENTE|nr:MULTISPECIES: carbohydrate ABC transporter permease [Enterococcus]KAF1301432.1 lactose ABC transporter permease [Enterococcus sp. CU12B]MCD5003080.1 carbohydrate ABC transporter permease [Enterococcus saccharolyticus]